MAKITTDDVIEYINNNDQDMISLYGGIDVMIQYLEKRNRLQDIDFKSDSIDDIRDKIFWTLVNSDNPEVRKKTYDTIKNYFINNDLNDIDGKWYMVLGTQSDLSMFFCSGGRDSDSDKVENILSEDFWEPYGWDTTDEVFRDVVEVLNEDNKRRFKEIVKSKLVGMQVETITKVLESFCEEGGCDEITVTDENFDQIFNDENSIKYVIKRILTEINSELYSIHSNAYNSAYTDECFEEVWDKLNDLFGSTSKDSKWVEFKRNNKNIYQYYVNVDNNIDEHIYSFLQENHKYSFRDSLTYYGSYQGIIKEMMGSGGLDCLSIRLSDHPNWRKVDELINEYFTDNF